MNNLYFLGRAAKPTRPKNYSYHYYFKKKEAASEKTTSYLYHL